MKQAGFQTSVFSRGCRRSAVRHWERMKDEQIRVSYLRDIDLPFWGLNDDPRLVRMCRRAGLCDPLSTAIPSLIKVPKRRRRPR
jgi:hypothetical protein